MQTNKVTPHSAGGNGSSYQLLPAPVRRRTRREWQRELREATRFFCRMERYDFGMPHYTGCQVALCRLAGNPATVRICKCSHRRATEPKRLRKAWSSCEAGVSDLHHVRLAMTKTRQKVSHAALLLRPTVLVGPVTAASISKGVDRTSGSDILQAPAELSWSTIALHCSFSACSGGGDHLALGRMCRVTAVSC